MEADGDGFHAPEAHTKASVGRDAGGSVGVLRAWHAEREARRTWETPGVPGNREAHPIKKRAANDPWGVGSPQSTRRAGEPLTGGSCDPFPRNGLAARDEGSRPQGL